MGRDRSLDEFFGGGNAGEKDESDADADGSSAESAAGSDGDAAPVVEEAEDTEEAEDAGSTDADGDAPGTDDALPDATPAYRWTPEDAACESCGAAVERRWEDDGAFVCDDCKEW